MLTIAGLIVLPLAAFVLGVMWGEDVQAIAAGLWLRVFHRDVWKQTRTWGFSYSCAACGAVFYDRESLMTHHCNDVGRMAAYDTMRKIAEDWSREMREATGATRDMKLSHVALVDNPPDSNCRIYESRRTEIAQIIGEEFGVHTARLFGNVPPSSDWTDYNG